MNSRLPEAPPVLAAFLFSLVFGAGVSYGAVELEPRTLGSSPGGARATASGFAADRFLTAWTEGPRISGAFSDAQGRRISPQPLVLVSNVLAETLQVIGAGDSFLILARVNNGPLYFARIDRNGGLELLKQLPVDSLLGIRAAWNGEELVLLSRQNELFVFDRDGNLRRGPLALSRNAGEPYATLSDGSLLFLKWGFADLQASRVMQSGDVGETMTLERAIGTTTLGYYPNWPALAATPDGGAIVAFAGQKFDEPSLLKTVAISPDGGVSAANVIPTDRYTSIDSVYVARQGDQYRLYFRATRERQNGAELWELAGVTVDSSGKATAPVAVVATGFPFATAFTYAVSPAVTLAVTRPFNPPVAQAASYALPAPGSVTPEVLSLGPSAQPEVLAGANARGFVGAWNDFVGSSTTVHTAGIDPATGTNTLIRSLPGVLATHRMASGPTDHLVLHRTDKDLIATRMDSSGEPLASVVIGTAGIIRAQAVWTGAGYLVAWGLANRLVTTYVTDAETAVRNEIVLEPLPGEERYATSVDIAFDGTSTVVVWTDTQGVSNPFPSDRPGSFESKIMARRLTTTGTPVDERVVDLGTVPQPAMSARIWAGRNDFVVRMPHEPTLRQLRAGVSGLTVRPPSTLGDSLSLGDIAWNGEEYVIAGFGRGRQISLARMDRDGWITAPVLYAPAPGAFSVPSVAATGGQQIVLAPVAIYDSVRAMLFPPGDFLLTQPPAEPTRRRSVGRR